LQMTHDLDPNARVMAFEALCLMKGGDVVEASRKVDDAMAQAPKDPLVLATFAQVLMATNAVERARSAIEKAIAESEPSRLQQAIRLKAQMCQASNDQACQSRYWSMLVERNPRSLEALAGLARVQLNSGDIDGAKKYLMKGLQISANYKPFFPINRAISLNEDRDKARGL
jgi:thioredoxin-like negative regulator of GroEL